MWVGREDLPLGTAEIPGPTLAAGLPGPVCSGDSGARRSEGSVQAAPALGREARGRGDKGGQEGRSPPRDTAQTGVPTRQGSETLAAARFHVYSHIAEGTEMPWRWVLEAGLGASWDISHKRVRKRSRLCAPVPF